MYGLYTAALVQRQQKLCIVPFSTPGQLKAMLLQAEHLSERQHTKATENWSLK